MQKSHTHMRVVPEAGYWSRIKDKCRFWRDRRTIWIILCGLQAVLGVSAVSTTQGSAATTLLALIIWWGACLSCEDVIIELKGKPSILAAISGTVILIFCSWRLYATYHLDSIIYALFGLQGLALFLVGWPIKHNWRKAQKPVFILSLFGLQLLAQRAIPMPFMTRATAKAVEIFLALFDFQILSQGNKLVHTGGSLIVVDGCSGLDLAIQLTVIALIFTIVFPLESRKRLILAVVLAPLIAFAVNCIRVSLLTLIHASDLSSRHELFNFVHEQWGGLLFAGIAVSVFGWIYLHWIERQIRTGAS